MADERKPYFTINGSEHEGWTVNLYRWVKDGTGRYTDAVSPVWARPESAKSFEDAIAIVLENDLPLP